MKLKEYQTYDDFNTVTFESDSGNKIEFTISNGDDITVYTQGLTIAEIEECIDIIERGFLEIIL